MNAQEVSRQKKRRKGSRNRNAGHNNHGFLPENGIRIQTRNDLQNLDSVVPVTFDPLKSNRRHRHQDDIPAPVKRTRKCRDVLCLSFFIMSVLLMIIVAVYAVYRGDYRRFTNGVDFNCDICNNTNPILPGIQNSGRDLRGRGYLLALGRTDGMAEVPTTRECRAACPIEFKEVLTRCVATTPEARAIVTDVSLFQEIGEDLENFWKDIIWMCVIALGLSFGVSVLLRLFAGVIIWVFVFGVSLCGLGGSIALWLTWWQKNGGNVDDSQSISPTSLMVISIFVSLITFLLLLVFIYMRRRIALVIRLFNEAGKAVHAMPLLLFQPIFTFLALGFSLGGWIAVLVLVESSGIPVQEIKDGHTRCYFKKDAFTMFSRWWNFFMITWIAQFIIGCQHLIIAGAVSVWFFTRNKRRLGFPILVSLRRLIRYHLGSVAFGSLIISIVKLVRFIIHTIQKRVGDKNPVSRVILWVCNCAIACLENVLIFLNKNAYIEIAIHGSGFCKSARKAFHLIANNALRVAAINSIGDFVLFLGKVAILSLTVFIGHELIKNKEGINHIWVPLTVGGMLAFFIAHCFISVYEMAIDTVFICFCEDCEMNDGLTRPYYMSKGLMEFVKSSEKELQRKRRTKNKDDAAQTQHGDTARDQNNTH